MATQLKKYTAKPRQVDAVQVDQQNINDLAKDFRGAVGVNSNGGISIQYLLIPTIDGNITASLGDYLLVHPNNILEVQTQAAFEQIYQNA